MNQLGVFLNADVIRCPLPPALRCEASISLGFAKQKWWVGYEANIQGNDVGTGGAGALPACNERREGFATREQAIIAGWKRVRDFFGGTHQGNFRVMRRAKKVLEFLAQQNQKKHGDGARGATRPTLNL